MNVAALLVHYLAAAEWTVSWRGRIKVTVESAVGECEMFFTHSADECVRVSSLIHLSLSDDLGPSVHRCVVLLSLICDSNHARIACYPTKGGSLLLVIRASALAS